MEYEAKGSADYSDIIQETEKLDKSIQEVADSLQTMAEQAIGVNKATNTITTSLNAEEEAVKQLVTQVTSYNAAGQKIIETSKVIAGQTAQVTRQVIDLGKAYMDTEQQAQALARLKDAAASGYDTAANKATFGYRMNVGKYSKGTATADELEATAAASSKLRAVIANEMQRTGASVDQMTAKIKGLSAAMADPGRTFSASNQKIVDSLRAVERAAEQEGTTHRKIVNQQIADDQKKTLALTANSQKEQQAFNDRTNKHIANLRRETEAEQKELAKRAAYVAHQQKMKPEIWAGVDKTLLNKYLTDTGQSFDAIRYKLQELGKENAKVTNGFTLSWQSVERLIAIQFIHTVTRALFKAFNDGLERATEFQKQIAQIQTLAQNDPKTFQGWSEAIANIASKNNLDAIDAAKAGYEALSNQVQRTGDVLQFLSTTAQFARVTNSSLTDSVNLITAVMNSYGYSAGHAETISASLFRTIDLGRVKASEMSSTIGRLLVSTSALGISLYESEAALAALSIKGTRVSEAYTLITAVTQKLLKPTKEMNELFKEWGVNSGEAAIKTYGMFGVLMKIQDATKAGKGGPDLTELFNNIRGIRGIQGLTSDDGEEFKRYLNEIQNNSTGPYNKAKTFVNEPPTVKLEKEYRAFQTYFTSELGPQVASTLESINSGTLGLTNSVKILVPVMKNLAVALAALAIPALVIKLARMAVSFYEMTAATIAWAKASREAKLASYELEALQSKGFGPLSGIYAGTAIIATAITAYTAYYEWQKQKAQEQFDLQVRLEEQVTQRYRQQLDSRREEQEKFFNAAFISMNQAFADIRIQQDKIGDGLVESAKDATNILNKTLARIDEVYTEIGNRLQTSIINARTEIDAILKRAYSRPRTEEEKDFEHSLTNETDEDKKATLLRNRFAKLRAESQVPVSGNVDESRAQYENRRGLVQESITLSDRLEAHLDTQIAKVKTQIEKDKQKLDGIKKEFEGRTQNAVVTEAENKFSEYIAGEQQKLNKLLAEENAIRKEKATLLQAEDRVEKQRQQTLEASIGIAEHQKEENARNKDIFDVKRREFEKYKLPTKLGYDADPAANSKILDDEYAKAYKLFADMRDAADATMPKDEARRVYEAGIAQLDVLKKQLEQKQAMSQLDDLEAKRLKAQSDFLKANQQSKSLVTDLDELKNTLESFKALSSKSIAESLNPNTSNGILDAKRELQTAIEKAERRIQLTASRGEFATDKDTIAIAQSVAAVKDALAKVKAATQFDQQGHYTKSPVTGQAAQAGEIAADALDKFDRAAGAFFDAKRQVIQQQKEISRLEKAISDAGLKIPDEIKAAATMKTATELFRDTVNTLIQGIKDYGFKPTKVSNTVGQFEPRNAAFVSNNTRSNQVNLGGLTMHVSVSKMDDLLTDANVTKIGQKLRRLIAQDVVNLTA